MKNLKQIAIFLVSALSISGAALADGYYYSGHDGHHRRHHHYDSRYEWSPPVVVMPARPPRYVYTPPPPPPVYYYESYEYVPPPPPPVYYQRYETTTYSNPIGGAVAGAALGSLLSGRGHRNEGAAIGALIGWGFSR